MATLTIRNLDDDLLARLRERAAQHGRSMAEEARNILYSVLATQADANQGTMQAKAARAGGVPLEGVELMLSQRALVREPPSFSDVECDE